MTDTPLTRLEIVLQDGIAGRASPADLHAAVLESVLYVPSSKEIGEDGNGLTPFLLPSPSSDVGMVLAFTHADRITAEARAIAPYTLEIPGSALIGILPMDLGMLVLAGPGVAAELDPATLDDMRQSLFS